ncbi:hypothetical protein Ate01nite_66400 [Actinoplanes teichomyceticus]|nr:hypothetical protein Ate01nite_66400 [Actinoplanes teichomyceticus]
MIMMYGSDRAPRWTGTRWAVMDGPPEGRQTYRLRHRIDSRRLALSIHSRPSDTTLRTVTAVSPAQRAFSDRSDMCDIPLQEDSTRYGLGYIVAKV